MVQKYMIYKTVPINLFSFFFYPSSWQMLSIIYFYRWVLHHCFVEQLSSLLQLRRILITSCVIAVLFWLQGWAEIAWLTLFGAKGFLKNSNWTCSTILWEDLVSPSTWFSWLTGSPIRRQGFSQSQLECSIVPSSPWAWTLTSSTHNDRSSTGIFMSSSGCLDG